MRPKRITPTAKTDKENLILYDKIMAELLLSQIPYYAKFNVRQAARLGTIEEIQINCTRILIDIYGYKKPELQEIRRSLKRLNNTNIWSKRP